MNVSVLLLVLLVLASVGYYLGRRRAVSIAGGKIRDLHSLPSYYAMMTAMWCGIPALFVFLLWLSLEPVIISNLVTSGLPPEVQNLPEDRLALVLNDIKNQVKGNIPIREPDAMIQAAADRYQQLQTISKAALAVVMLALAIAGLVYGKRSIHPETRARNQVEKVITLFLVASSTIAIFTTIGIVLSVLFESIRFFKAVPITDFLFGTEWSPQTAIRADQVGSSGAFGAVPLFAGTFLITFIAMIVAVPVGLMSAIYLSEYAGRKLRAVAKPLLEILAGIPTVVYGFFAALTVAPLVRDTGGALGLDVASESALAAGMVMGIMIIPFVSSLSDDVINAVPQAMRCLLYTSPSPRDS